MFQKPVENRCLFLLLSLVFLLLAYPYLETGAVKLKILSVFASVSLLGGVYALARERKHFLIAIALAIPTFGFHWSGHFISWEWLRMPAVFFPLLFYGYITLMVFQFVLKEETVTREKISAAICAYLLIGFFWGCLFCLLERLQPGSFNIHETAAHPAWPQLIYFSFSTLTTAGYGDILPLSSHARSLASLEAIVGVLYLVIVISQLVSRYRQEPSEK